MPPDRRAISSSNGTDVAVSEVMSVSGVDVWLHVV